MNFRFYIWFMSQLKRSELSLDLDHIREMGSRRHFEIIFDLASSEILDLSRNLLPLSNRRV